MHTGEPLLGEEGYVGLDVHRAARIAAAGHGGQVLLSADDRERWWARTALRDLGRAPAEGSLRAAAACSSSGKEDFPPLKSL